MDVGFGGTERRIDLKMKWRLGLYGDYWCTSLPDAIPQPEALDPKA